MTTEELAARAASAIDKSEYTWRTVSGLAKELRVEAEAVEDVLDNSGKFVRSRSPSAKGEALYTTLTRYRREIPRLQRLFGAAANTVSSNS